MRVYAEKHCIVCGATHRRRGVTCSGTCAAVARRASGALKTCEYCQSEFRALHHFDRFCSAAHHATCQNCGKEFEIADVRRPAISCSPSCATALGHNEHSKLLRKERSLEKWGVESPLQAPAVKAKIKANESARASKYGSPQFNERMMEHYGVNNGFLLPSAVPGRISSVNRRWREILEEATELPWELEHAIAGARTVDLYVEHAGKKLAVEAHPTATHNSHKNLIACNRRGCSEFPCAHAKGKMYHQQRSRAMHEQGVQLVSIFDWMPEKRIVEFIRGALHLNKHRVAARKCEIKRISQKEANSFLREFHMLGDSQRQEYCYGLFYDGLLVQVQTFSRRANDWEARRLASRDNWQVIGGVSRGTKAFIREAVPERIVAFSDLSLSWPDFDSTFNGFAKREIQPPVLCWSKGTKMVLNKSAAVHSADRLIGLAKNSKSSPYGEELTNEEIFLAEGWLPVWDCGKLKETWELS